MRNAESDPPLWYLMGPTASGKTDLAIALSRRFPFEIISVDSSLVYCGMDIGTAKPGAEVLRRTPHHLINIRQPQDSYSVAEFLGDVRELVEAIRARGNFPLLVGGTMFYFRALELGLPPVPVARPELRLALASRGSLEGWPALHRELARLDPARAQQIGPTDKQRIQRSLEIVLSSGRSSTESPFYGRNCKNTAGMPVCKLALAPANRNWLHRRIERRFEAMLDAGLVAEVRGLLNEKGLTPELPALRMVGYRQVVQYLSAELEYNEMARRGIASTRQLAKRQLTWLRNQPGVTWVDCSSRNLLDTVAAYVSSKFVSLGLFGRVTDANLKSHD